jgi:hypothetical protein
MSSTDHMKTIMLAASAAGATIFRNNVAQGVVSNSITWIKGREQSVTVRPGDAVVRGAREVHAGLFEGSADLIGWTPIVITPDMVGRTVAVFTSIEAKSGTGRLETDQKTWMRNVLAAGGLAGEGRDPETAARLIRDFKGRE